MRRQSSSIVATLIFCGCAGAAQTHVSSQPPISDDDAGDSTPPATTPPAKHADAAAPAEPDADATGPESMPDAAPPVDAKVAASDDAGPVGPPPPATTACGTGAKKLGPPTAAELKIVDMKLRAMPYVPAGTNHGNNFAYGTAAKAAGDLRSMYNLTKDLYYLDQSVVFADYMLSQRNDPMTGRITWTGKREPCWPNNDVTDPDAGACGMETGAVADQILATAKIIVADKTLWDKTVGIGDPNKYGATYILRARTYLREAIASMDYITGHFINPMSHRILTPTDPLYTALGPNYLKAAGRAVPWNQQEMVTSPLGNIADILTVLGEQSDRVAAGDVIIKASMEWFIGELTANKYMVNGVTVYKWGYNPGDLYHVEDLAHASGDINALYKQYQRGHYGIDRSILVPIANTFFELVAKPDGTYAAHVDGKGSRTSLSNSWSNYEEFRTGIIARLHPTLTVDATTAVAEGIQILGLRQKFCK